MKSTDVMSPEHKARISEALKTAWSDPEFRAQTVAAQTKGCFDAWADESKRAKRLAKLRETLAAKKAAAQTNVVTQGEQE